jgi:hypothetical protein
MNGTIGQHAITPIASMLMGKESFKSISSGSSEQLAAPEQMMTEDWRTPKMPDKVLQEIAEKIGNMSLEVDGDPAIPAGDTQWRKGYKQACSDIVAMVCQIAAAQRT